MFHPRDVDPVKPDEARRYDAMEAALKYTTPGRQVADLVATATAIEAYLKGPAPAPVAETPSEA